MKAKFKLDDELLIFKGSNNVLIKIIKRELIKDLDADESMIRYTYTIPDGRLAEIEDEDMLILLNQFAEKYKKLESEI